MFIGLSQTAKRSSSIALDWLRQIKARRRTNMMRMSLPRMPVHQKIPIRFSSIGLDWLRPIKARRRTNMMRMSLPRMPVHQNFEFTIFSIFMGRCSILVFEKSQYVTAWMECKVPINTVQWGWKHNQRKRESWRSANIFRRSVLVIVFIWSAFGCSGNFGHKLMQCLQVHFHWFFQSAQRTLMQTVWGSKKHENLNIKFTVRWIF